jgi:hypothetical protein
MRKIGSLLVIVFLAMFAASTIVHTMSANAMVLDMVQDMAMSEDGAMSMADCRGCIADEGGKAGVAACDLTCTAPIAGTLGESGGLVKVVLLSRPERLPAGNLPLGLRSQPDLFPPIALI